MTSFVQYKQYMICLISFNQFSYVLLAFTCASAIGNLSSICLEVNILNPFPCDFIENAPLRKALSINSGPS